MKKFCVEKEQLPNSIAKKDHLEDEMAEKTPGCGGRRHVASAATARGGRPRITGIAGWDGTGWRHGTCRHDTRRHALVLPHRGRQEILSKRTTGPTKLTKKTTFGRKRQKRFP